MLSYARVKTYNFFLARGYLGLCKLPTKTTCPRTQLGTMLNQRANQGRQEETKEQKQNTNTKYNRSGIRGLTVSFLEASTLSILYCEPPLDLFFWTTARVAHNPATRENARVVPTRDASIKVDQGRLPFCRGKLFIFRVFRCPAKDTPPSLAILLIRNRTHGHGHTSVFCTFRSYRIEVNSTSASMAGKEAVVFLVDCNGEFSLPAARQRRRCQPVF